MRLRITSTVCLVLAGGLILGCGSRGSGTARPQVLARLGGPAAHVEPPGLAVRELLLGAKSRQAVEGALPFEVTTERPIERLLFSVGVRGGAARASFSIEAAVGERWRSIHRETLRRGAPTWYDRIVDLRQLGAPVRRFRFEASAGETIRKQGVEPVWGSVTFLGRPEPGSPAAARPNVVILLLDTLGAEYLTRFGGLPDATPNLDAFLDASFEFRRAYAQYGMTLVSSASLLTGLYPKNHGVFPDGGVWSFPSLVEQLADDGYLTVAFTEGGWVSSQLGFQRGFDWYDNGPPLSVLMGDAPRIFGQGASWLERFGASSRFVLLLHTYEVHGPYIPREASSRRIVEEVTPGDASIPSREFQLLAGKRHNTGRKVLPKRMLDKLRGLYIAKIHELDGVIADFFSRLAELGLEEDTLVVLAADHGELFGEDGRIGHASSLNNLVLHVPLGFRWPARFDAGASDTPVQLVDVMPTILELLGIAGPAGLDGRSLAPAILGRASDLARRPAFTELRSTRTECIRLGLPQGCRLDRYVVQTERFKLISSGVPTREVLYDLEHDPRETRDASAEQPEALARHRALLEAYRSASGAPSTPAREVLPAPLDEAARRKLEALGYLQ